MSPLLQEIEAQECRERHAPELGPRLYRGGGIEADERERLEEVRSWLLVAVVALIVLAALFLGRPADTNSLWGNG